MKKESKMIKLKQDNMAIRKKLVIEGCEKLVSDSISISYKQVANITDIPHKTLEREPYRSVINYYRDTGVNNQKNNSKEVTVLKDRVSYLEVLIKQLNKENHNLKTKLYEDKKI